MLEPALQRLLDDDLAGAPMLADALLQTLERASGLVGVPGLDTATAAQLQDALNAQHRAMVALYCDALRTPHDAPPSGRPARGLSLVDDEAVSTDVELARTVEAISSVAEAELRELGAYTSALVGDLHVARDTNPLKPERHARALWAAAGALPPSRGLRIAFMRAASMPLAQALRKTYAAACTRLEDAGVEPAAYRTMILPPGTRSARRDKPPPALPGLRDSMPMPLDMPDAPVPIPQTPLADRQGSALIRRLFDTILGDDALAADARRLVARLQAPALQLASRDAALLESYDHPLWHFVDRLAFACTLQAGDDAARRAKLLARLQALVDGLAQEPLQEARRYRWALERVAALERHVFEQRVAAAAPEIAALQTLAGPAPAGGAAPLDVGTLDTVPAALLDAREPAQPAKATWLDAPSDGTWLHLFLQGDWRTVHLLWHDGPLWLLGSDDGGATWALRRSAVEQLHAAGLVQPHEPRSLVQRAARIVLRDLAAG